MSSHLLTAVFLVLSPPRFVGERARERGRGDKNFGFAEMRRHQCPGWELYDLVKDPEELKNVYDDPSYAGVRDQLKTEFARLRKQIGDDGTHYQSVQKSSTEIPGLRRNRPPKGN